MCGSRAERLTLARLASSLLVVGDCDEGIGSTSRRQSPPPSGSVVRTTTGVVSESWILARNDEWPHHVVLLVLEDVAVPHVLVATGAGAVWNVEWHRRERELHHHRGDLVRIHPDRILPTELRCVRTACGAQADRLAVPRGVELVVLERPPGQHLDIDEVGVQRMDIARQIGDLPGLDVVPVW